MSVFHPYKSLSASRTATHRAGLDKHDSSVFRTRVSFANLSLGIVADVPASPAKQVPDQRMRHSPASRVTSSKRSNRFLVMPFRSKLEVIIRSITGSDCCLAAENSALSSSARRLLFPKATMDYFLPLSTEFTVDTVVLLPQREPSESQSTSWERSTTFDAS